MTGVLFRGNLDARLTYYTGPFHGSWCRIEDAQEMHKIDIGGAFRDMPEFAPTQIKSH